ncbi:MAG: carboxypeptidase-like regulatory domain-containing protein, partial [Actinomycetia bacterium]|nr:carboxypeptidase-like regulatory domain-containing protein [Actinomycetes bacterium]
LAPGAYTLTVAANGYTTQTSKLTITAGQSSVTHSAVLSSAFGAVYGTVVDATGAAQVGAGVVLANATNTYKVTTTSTPVPGAFTFAGVVPGTYTLTTQLFGFGVETVTVTVVAGATKQVAVALEVAASTVAATGHVTGTVVDLSTGIAPDSSIQVTASVDNPNYDASLGANVTCNVPAFTATVDGNRPYTLPDPTTDPDCGLPPGLYTITVSAPDYEAGTVSIPLPLGATVLAPVATLAPAPKLMGAISVTADSAPAGPTCVWAAATGATVDTSALVCLPPSAPNPGCPATLPTGTLCQSVAGGTGDYEMTVPAHGSYQVWIQSSDPEFRTQGTTAAPLALNAASVMLPRASTAQYNAVMNRFGRAQVTVQEASTATGALAPAAGVTIRVQRSCSVTTLVTPAPTFQPPTTGADGVTLASGLNGTYGFAVTSAATGATGCIPVTANLNTTATYVLPVTQAVPYIIGRVVYNMDGQLTPVANATVQLTGVSGFTGTTALTPTSSTWAVTTDADGCFLIHSAGDSTPVNVTDPNCPNLDSEYLASGASNPTVASSTYIGQLANTTLISNLMSSVVVLGNADFNPYPPSAMTMAPDSVTDLVVVPAPLALSSPANAIAVNPAGTFPTGLTDSSGTPITSWPQFWNAVTLQVQPGTASATIDAGSSGTTTFHLATSAGVDRVPAGTYTLRAYFNGSGFQTATIKLICAPLQGCTLRDPATGAASAFEINQQASLKITLNGGGTTVSGAKVSLIYNGSPVTSATTDGSSSATFTRQLVPNDTSYSIGVQAAGFKFIPDNATLSCSGPVLSAGVGPGVTLSCTVNLTKLGTIHGTARSYDVTPPDYLTPGAPIYSGLSNLEVTATRCSGTVQTDATTNLSYCVPSTDVFTATTGSDGSYTLSGTATAEGLVDGDWIVSVTSPYRCAAPSYDPTTPSGCPSPSSAVGSNPLGVAITISGGAITAGDPTINFVHLPAVLTVNAVVFGGGPASPASGVSLQLTSTSDPNILETPTVDSTHDNVFTFNPLPPGTYTVTAIGAGFQTQSFQVTLADGGSTQTIPLAQVSGGIAVTVNAGGAPVADAHVCLVLTKGAGPCVGSPNNPTIITTVLASDIVDTDGHHTGTYVFASAPFMLMPYYVQVDGVYGYENWFGNVPPSIVGGFTQFTAALTPVTRNVELTITATDTNDNIAGAAWTTARLVQVPPDSGPTPPIAANVNLGIPSGSANIATFSAPQLMWGCWRLAYQITGHFGTISMTGGLALTDGTLTCPENSILVSGDTLPTDQPVTGTYGDVAATGTLAEYLASVRVTADDGGSQLATPAYINVTATDNAVPSLTYFDSAVAVAATATELAWVPTGATVNLTVAFQTGTDSHWEILTNSVLTITSSVPTATVNLAVPVSTVTVNVTNAFDPTTGVAATVTLTPPSAYSITPSTSTTANGVCAIDGVFYGDWTLSVTPPTPATSYPSDEITQTVAVSSGTTTVDIQVKPLTKNVTVAVSNSDGITSAGAGVSVTLTAPAGWDAPTGCTSTPVLVGGNWTCTQTTGADGTVTFAGVYYTISSTIPTYTASSGTAPSITFGVRNNAPAPNPKIILSSP